MIYGSIAFWDPGDDNGLSIFDEGLSMCAGNQLMWFRVNTAEVKYKGHRHFGDTIDAIIKRNNIRMAVIEEYVNFGKKYKRAHYMFLQQRIIQEHFPNHILIGKKTWDPLSIQPKFQRQLLMEYWPEAEKWNEHCRDSANMALNIFRRLPTDNIEKADYLFARAKEQKTIGGLL